MALISLSGVHGTEWIYFADDQDIAEGAYALVTLARLAIEGDALFDVAGQLAVTVEGDTDSASLAPYADRLAGIIVHFEKFNDGRAFSLAGRVRRDLGFKGELRATGHTIPDQAQFLLRSGFDTADVEDSRADAFKEAAKRYAHFYQCTINGDMSVAHRRHMAEAG